MQRRVEPLIFGVEMKGSAATPRCMKLGSFIKTSSYMFSRQCNIHLEGWRIRHRRIIVPWRMDKRGATWSQYHRVPVCRTEVLRVQAGHRRHSDQVQRHRHEEEPH